MSGAGGRLRSSDAHRDGHISRAYVIESLSSSVLDKYGIGLVLQWKQSYTW